MEKIKKSVRLLSLLFLICLAAIIPVPIMVYQKDKTPKFVLEQIDEKEDDDEDESTLKIT